MWKEAQGPGKEDLRRRLYELQVEKQNAFYLGLDFFHYYVDYRFLLFWAQRLAEVLDVDLSEDRRYVEWQQLDKELTYDLRGVLAFPELALVREDIETWITRWD